MTDTKKKEPKAFEGERLAKVLARAGVASRREAEKLIEAGRVSVDGKKITSPALNVTEKNIIALDGEPIKRPRKPVSGVIIRLQAF
jgi:23S rRNA pseudouridine2605 synthase